MTVILSYTLLMTILPSQVSFTHDDPIFGLSIFTSSLIMAFKISIPIVTIHVIWHGINLKELIAIFG